MAKLPENIEKERVALRERIEEINRMEALVPAAAADGDGKALVCCVGKEAAAALAPTE